MASPAERSILLGLQLGQAIGEPINRAMMQKADQEFRKKIAQDQLERELQMFKLKNPNLSLSQIQPQAGITVDGQESLKPLPMNSFMVGNEAYDPQKIKDLDFADQQAQADREFNLRKMIEDYKSNQPQIDEKLGVEIIRTPEGYKYRQILPYSEGVPLKGTIDRDQEFQRSEAEKDRESRKTLAELALEKSSGIIKSKPLSESERNSLFSLANSKGFLTTALSDYDQLNQGLLGGSVGPVAGIREGIKSFAGFGDKDFKAFNARIKSNLFGSARALQGAGVLTEKDIERMEAISPTARDTRNAFIGGLEGMRQVMLDRSKAFKEVNSSRMNPQEKLALDAVIEGLSEKIGSENQLSTDQAREFLKRANGDKNKARELAKEAGFNF